MTTERDPRTDPQLLMRNQKRKVIHAALDVVDTLTNLSGWETFPLATARIFRESLRNQLDGEFDDE